MKPVDEKRVRAKARFAELVINQKAVVASGRRVRKWLEANRGKVVEFSTRTGQLPSIYGGFISWYGLSHADVVYGIKTFGGKFHKRAYSHVVEYRQETKPDEVHVELNTTEAGPGCHWEEREVWVEPTPGHMETSRKLVCPLHDSKNTEATA